MKGFYYLVALVLLLFPSVLFTQDDKPVFTRHVRSDDVDGDGVRTQADYLAFAGCVTGPVPLALVPGCEMMDGDGDGRKDSEQSMMLPAYT